MKTSEKRLLCLAIQRRTLDLAFNPDEPRGPDGRWIKIGSGVSEITDALKKMKIGQSVHLGKLDGYVKGGEDSWSGIPADPDAPMGPAKTLAQMTEEIQQAQADGFGARVEALEPLGDKHPAPKHVAHKHKAASAEDIQKLLDETPTWEDSPETANEPDKSPVAVASHPVKGDKITFVLPEKIEDHDHQTWTYNGENWTSKNLTNGNPATVKSKYLLSLVKEPPSGFVVMTGEPKLGPESSPSFPIVGTVYTKAKEMDALPDGTVIKKHGVPSKVRYVKIDGKWHEDVAHPEAGVSYNSTAINSAYGEVEVVKAPPPAKWHPTSKPGGGVTIESLDAAPKGTTIKLADGSGSYTKTGPDSWITLGTGVKFSGHILAGYDFEGGTPAKPSTQGKHLPAPVTSPVPKEVESRVQHVYEMKGQKNRLFPQLDEDQMMDVFGGRDHPYTDEQKQELHHYTGAGASTINYNLRHGGTLTTEEHIIDSAMQPSRRAQMLFRRIPSTALGVPTDGSALDTFKALSALKGKTIEDRGYLSTSHTDDVLNTPFLVLRIKAPKGTPGAFIEPVSGYKSEHEALLARDLPLKIGETHWNKDSAGNNTMVVDVVVDTDRYRKEHPDEN